MIVDAADLRHIEKLQKSPASVPGKNVHWETKAKPKYDRDLNAIKLTFSGRPSLWYVRGAVVWPRGRVPGFALLAGQELRSGVVVMFDELQFESVRTHVIDEKREEGFARFVQNNFNKFLCRKYFYSPDSKDQIDQIHRRYRLECSRAAEIERDAKPHFLKCLYARDDENVDRIIFDALRRKKFFGKRGSMLQLALKTGHDDPVAAAGVQCMRNLFAGLRRYRWMPNRQITGEVFKIKDVLK